MLSGQGIIFLGNPKAASTAIKTALIKSVFCQQGEQHGTPADISSNKHFCVVRSPYDRMVSGYFYFCKERQWSFRKWLTGEKIAIATGVDFLRTPQFHWTGYCQGRGSKVLRFEKLAEDWQEFLDTEGLNAPLERKNPGNKRAGTHYRDVIDPVSRSIIEDRFRVDFDNYDYEW